MFKTKILHPPCDLSDALSVRDTVFTKEQGFTIPDEDEFDAVAIHLVVYHSDRPVATGRCYHEKDMKVFHIGRICVFKEFRKHKLGILLMEELEKISLKNGASKLIVGAQLYAVPFYEKCGFQRTGERFFEEFCEHETLIKII